MTISTAQSPGDVYTLDLSRSNPPIETTGNTIHVYPLTRWTKRERKDWTEELFVLPELFEYPSFDERMIPCFLYLPPVARAAKERRSATTETAMFPVVIYSHGGPESQSRPSLDETFQMLVQDFDCCVLVPNVRGSSGYGKEYLLLDNGFQREDAVRDIESLVVNWIPSQAYMDVTRAAVWGRSYGGYMALSSLARLGHGLCCGVDIVGVSNFVTFLETTEEYRREWRRTEYGDERDPEMRRFLTNISPTALAKDIVSPLLIVQGLNDPRVPVTEAEQIRDLVRWNGVPVWYALAKEEGHVFKRTRSKVFCRTAMMFFFDPIPRP